MVNLSVKIGIEPMAFVRLKTQLHIYYFHDIRYM